MAGVRGRRVFDDGDVDAGIWTVGTAMGLINDIPTVGELVARIVAEAEDLITGRLAGMVTLEEEESAPPRKGGKESAAKSQAAKSQKNRSPP